MLSIIIVTFNSREVILDCLRSLPDTVAGAPPEIMVVDNASHDGTPDCIASEFPEVRLIRNETNVGFAAANNQALELASGEYIALINPDVVVHPDALARMVDYLAEQRDVGIVGPRTFAADGSVAVTAQPPKSVLTVAWSYMALYRILPDRGTGRFRRACETATEPFSAGWVVGACLLMRREVYEQIGGLDPGFFLFAEETDFCERAWQAGWEVKYLPAASVTHSESHVASRYTLIRIRSGHLSTLYYFRKRGQHLRVAALKLVFTVELLAKVALRAVQRLRARREDEEALRSRMRVDWTVLGDVWRY